MPESVPPFVDVLLSNGGSWLAEAVTSAPVRAANRLITPEEPSSLALAIVGIITVGIYVSVRGIRNRRRAQATPLTPVGFNATVRRRPQASVEKPKRGAA